MAENATFWPLAAVFGVGIAIPVLITVPLADVLSLYLTGRQFVYGAAVLFALVAWAVLAVWEFDHVDFLLGALVLPWVAFFTLFFVGVTTSGQLEGFRYLFFDIEDIFAYGGSFVVAGVAAIAIHRRSVGLTERYGGPDPRGLAMGVLLVLAVTVLLGGAVAEVTAGSATISAVQPGLDGQRGAALNVTVDGAPTELRLTVTAPDGGSITKRISYGSMRAAPSTRPIEFHRLGIPPVDGTYTVKLTSLMGQTVDSATYTLQKPPAPTLLGIRAAGAGDDLRLDLPPGSAEYRPSPGATDSNARVGVRMRNEGDVAAAFETRLFVGEDRVNSRQIFLEAGQQGGNVISLSVDDVERIHAAANGTVTVEVAYRGDRVRTAVDFPHP